MALIAIESQISVIEKFTETEHIQISCEERQSNDADQADEE